MKLRQPALIWPDQPFESKPETNRWSESFKVTTLTPIYGGGVKAGEPDLSMPVRASAIRGQLRFWWRLLKRYHPEPKHRVTNPRELFIAERELWGGMAENDRDYASKVRIRVRNVQNKKNISCSGFLKAQKKSAFDYVLFPARELADSEGVELIYAGMHFHLDAECPADDRREEVVQTLRWWASFGGVGARNRRGLGSLTVAGLTPVLETEAAQYGCQLVPRNAGDAIDAWHKAVEPLRKFRQEPGIGRNSSLPRPGRSFWPEPDSIRQITHCPDLKKNPSAPHPPAHPARISFPRAAFGLPIVFEFKGERTDPYKTELTTEQEGGRMASPLILKPMAMADGKFAAIALLLPLDHLNSLSLKLKRPGTARGSSALYRSHASTWWNPAKAPDVKPIFTNKGVDALTAFMNYFAKG